MANGESDQFDLAEAHLRTLLHLLPEVEAHHRWVVTTSFYCALKVVDAVLCVQEGARGTDHDDRNHIIGKNRKYSKIHRHYMTLYRQSRDARYEPHDTNVKPSSVVAVLVRGDLLEVLKASKTSVTVGGAQRLDSMIQAILEGCRAAQ